MMKPMTLTPNSQDSRIKELIVEVREGKASPSRLSEIQQELSAWYATIGEELSDIESLVADYWIELRKETTSDKMADKQLDASESGKRRIKLRIQAKYIEKVISSIKRRLEVLKQEAWNQI